MTPNFEATAILDRGVPAAGAGFRCQPEVETSGKRLCTIGSLDAMGLTPPPCDTSASADSSALSLDYPHHCSSKRTPAAGEFRDSFETAVHPVGSGSTGWAQHVGYLVNSVASHVVHARVEENNAS